MRGLSGSAVNKELKNFWLHFRPMLARHQAFIAGYVDL